MSTETNSQKLDRLLNMVQLLLTYGSFTANMEIREMQELDDLEAEVAGMRTAGEAMGAQIDFSVSLMDKIKSMLDEALAAPKLDKAKLVELRNMIHSDAAALDAKKDDLKAAADRDTPFQPSGQ